MWKGEHKSIKDLASITVPLLYVDKFYVLLHCRCDGGTCHFCMRWHSAVAQSSLAMKVMARKATVEEKTLFTQNKSVEAL